MISFSSSSVVFVKSSGWCFGSFVVICDVSSTNASPSLVISSFTGDSIMKLSYFSDTDHNIVSSKDVQAHDAPPLPCPIPRILYRSVVP